MQVEVLLRRAGLRRIDLSDPRLKRMRDGEFAWLPEGAARTPAWSLARLSLIVVGALGVLAMLLVWASR